MLLSIGVTGLSWHLLPLPFWDQFMGFFKAHGLLGLLKLSGRLSLSADGRSYIVRGLSMKAFRL